MVKYNPQRPLPTAEELLETDFAPVDSQLQVLIASLLDDILCGVWNNRTDWFWGINMGVYYEPQKPPIVPDGFLCLGVERLPRAGGRLSYVVWHENEIVPILAVDYVSQTYGGEYDTKKDNYAAIGVEYYVVYNPEFYTRYKHQPFEAYRLVNGAYELQSVQPYYWMPSVGLGIGTAEGTYRGWTREWLYWYDADGNRLPSADEQTQVERLRAEQERLRAEIERQARSELIAKLKERGIDPDTL